MALTTATIPSGWSRSSTCQNRSDNWIWFDSAWGMGVLGPPDQTSSCYPPDFTPTLGQLYTANSCPDGFTPACTTNYYSSSWSTICCPQDTAGFAYTCNYQSFWSWTAACVTSLSSYRSTKTVTATSFGKSERSTDGKFIIEGWSVLDGSTTNTGPVTTTGTLSYVATYISNQSGWALGVAILPQTQTSSAVDSSSVPLPSTTKSDVRPSLSTDSNANTSSSSGLSAGASAGIAIGALIAVIFVALGIWFFYRRAVKKRRGGGNTDPAGQQGHREERESKPLAQWRPDEYIPQQSPVEVHDQDFRRYELDVARRYPELP